MHNALREFLATIKTRLGAGHYVLTSPFGMRKNPVTGQEEFHNGIDLAPRAAPAWELIIPYEGGVEFLPNPHRSIGGLQMLWYLENYRVGLAHLESVRMTGKGFVLRIGSTGLSTGAHLHLTLAEKRGRRYEFVDPLSVINAL